MSNAPVKLLSGQQWMSVVALGSSPARTYGTVMNVKQGITIKRACVLSKKLGKDKE